MGAPDAPVTPVECPDGKLRTYPLAAAFRRGMDWCRRGGIRGDCPYNDLLFAFGRGPWLIRTVHSFARAWRSGWEHQNSTGGRR